MILAIDTSTSWLGIAIYDEAAAIFERVWKTQRRHTVELAPAVESALKECSLSISQLTALAVAQGPGSFTSLRIGMVFIKGLALAFHLPVIAVPSLDCLAYSQPGSGLPLICALHAGRGKLAATRYKYINNEWSSEGDCQVLTAKELVNQINAPTLVCGELDEEERRTLSRKWKSVVLATAANSLRRPGFLAELASLRLKAGKIDDPVTLVPIYLHTADPILS
jgi:tRNA threonylcarbamoyladenosine biosynthesis protein TsaB